MGIFISRIDVKTRAHAERLYPGKIILPCYGGWIAFETLQDAETWKKQK